MPAIIPPVSFSSIPLAHPLAVVPVLIGPMSVLLGILPAIALALGGRLIARFKPSALKATALLLWKKKIAVASVIVICVGAAYAWPHVFPSTTGNGKPVTLGNAEWAMFGGGPDRRGMAPGTSADPDSGGIKWAMNKEYTTFLASPAIVGNTLYITGESEGVFGGHSTIFCVDISDPRNYTVNWRYSPGDFRASYSSPVVAEGCVVSGEGFHTTPECRITCLNASTGEKIWSVTTHSKVESTPCIYKGKAYAGAGDDGFYCIDLKPGADGKPSVRWHLEGTNPKNQKDNYPVPDNHGKRYQDCDSSPIAYNGCIYFGLGVDGNAVVCVDAETGIEKWRTTGQYPVFCNPAIADNKLFVGMGNGNLINDARKVREQRWPAIESAMKARNASKAEMDKAYADLDYAGVIWTLDPATGAHVAPDVPLKNTVLGGIATADHKIYFGCMDGYFRSMSTSGGHLTEWNAHEPLFTSPAVGRKNVYFVTQSGQLIGLDRDTLKLVWQTSLGTGQYFFSSPAISNGHIYVGSGGDGLVCAGEPSGVVREMVWSGPRGGTDKNGWIDGDPLPAQGTFAWRYPSPSADADVPTTAPAEVPAMSVPLVYHRGAFFTAVAGTGKTGLTKLTPNKILAKDPAVAWFYPTANAITVSPVAAGSTLYVADGKPGQSNRHVAAVDVASGKSLWQYPLDTGASGTMLLMGDRLIVADKSNALTCLGIAGEGAGKPLWTVPMKVVGTPAFLNDMIFVSRADGPAVAALDSLSGAVLWQANLKAAPTEGPMVRDGQDSYVLAVGTEQGVVGLNLLSADAPIAWTAPVGAVEGPLACDGWHVACTTAAGDLVVLSWDGKQLARVKDVQPGVPPLMMRGTVVFAGKKAMQRLDFPEALESDQPMTTAAREPQPSSWMTTDWLGKISAAPILVNSYLYFGTDQKGLVCAKPKK